MTNDTTARANADDHVRLLERRVVSSVTGYCERHDLTPLEFLAVLEQMAAELDAAYKDALRVMREEKLKR
jgi:hypothetical protein